MRSDVRAGDRRGKMFEGLNKIKRRLSLSVDVVLYHQYIKAKPAMGDNTIIITENVNDSTEVSVARCSEGNISCIIAFVRT